MKSMKSGPGFALRCTIFLCIWGMGNIDDQHRNTNMNDKDHLVGQLIRPGWSQTSSSSCDSTVALAETEVS